MGSHRVPDRTVRDVLSNKPWPKSVWATMFLLGIDILASTALIMWVVVAFMF